MSNQELAVVFAIVSVGELIIGYIIRGVIDKWRESKRQKELGHAILKSDA